MSALNTLVLFGYLAAIVVILFRVLDRLTRLERLRRERDETWESPRPADDTACARS